VGSNHRQLNGRDIQNLACAVELIACLRLPPETDKSATERDPDLRDPEVVVAERGDRMLLPFAFRPRVMNRAWPAALGGSARGSIGGPDTSPRASSPPTQKTAGPETP
jgi:hypothetical protein